MNQGYILKRLFIYFEFQMPSPERETEKPSIAGSPDVELVNTALSPPASSGSSPVKQPSSPEAPALVFSQDYSPTTEHETTTHREPSQTAREQTDLSYTFSPPAVLQTPQRQGESTASSTPAQTTPSLEFIFSPPLTRSMARRRSSSLTPGALSYAR